MSVLEEVLSKLPNKNPPADESNLTNVQLDLHMHLPESYLEFLRLSNGYEGPIGNNYISLWEAEKLKELNEAYQLEGETPKYLLLGSDGGGEAYGFDLEKKEFINIPFIGIDSEEPVNFGSDFGKFLEKLYKS